MNCRHCRYPLNIIILDLGKLPFSNAYLSSNRAHEKRYPLRVCLCDRCWLVQTEDYAKAKQLFRPDYAYRSSTSTSWLKHSKKFVAQAIAKLSLNKKSFVVEVGSNDGYLLNNFVDARIPCLGVEPSSGPALLARQRGVPVELKFFGEKVSRSIKQKYGAADLIIGNNVYAHVPDINDFTRGLAALLKPMGIISLEFPHVLHLLREAQFDTVYHEHFSYPSLHAVCSIFKAAGLKVWHVEELSTHGGSLRIFGCLEKSIRPVMTSVRKMLLKEKRFGITRIGTYKKLQAKANYIKKELLCFLRNCKKRKKKVFGYGAAAKGNTLLNYAGIKPDLLPGICDAARSKQGKFMPGSKIPIFPPGRLPQENPDYVLVLPWNLLSEVMRQYSQLQRKKKAFVTVIPKVRIHVKR